MGSFSVQVFVVFFVGATMLDVCECDETDGRLPQNFRPYHYNLEFTPDFYQGAPPFQFNGSVQIYLTCIVASDVITINSLDLTIDNSSVKISLAPGQSGDLSEPVLSSWSLNESVGFLYVTTKDRLTRNVRYILEMNFNGTIRGDDEAINYEQYKSSDGNFKYMVSATTKYQNGRRMVPSFDEPDFKATFNITIVRRSPAISLANSRILNTIERGDGWFADIYNTTQKMSLHLVSFAVGEFEQIRAGGNNRYEVNYWARSEIIPYLNFTASKAAAMYDWLEKETGVPYSGPKADQLVVRDKSYMVQGWGLTRIRELGAALDHVKSTVDVTYALRYQCYLMAQQWYGNLVTCKWWDDIWLNVGISAYYLHRPMQALGWEGSSVTQIRIQEYLMEPDQRNSSVPARYSNKTIRSAWDVGYTDRTFDKGGAIIYMLEGILTTPTFKAGLTRYLKKYQYSTATTDDLWECLTKQAAIDGIRNPNGSALNIKLRMDPWLNQMGFPLVSVTRNETGTARLVRSHFLRPPNQHITKPSPYNYAWHVPITIVSEDSAPNAWDAAPSAWIDIDVSEVTVPGFPTNLSKWAVINPKASSFYRVMYDDASLDAIVSQLLRDHTVFHVDGRTQLIDDAFSVARAGGMSEINAMEITRYLSKEIKYGPWKAAIRHFKYSDRLIRKLPWGKLQRDYVLELATPIYKRLSWVFAENDTPFQRRMRSDLINIMCEYDHADCLSESRKQYKLIVENPSTDEVNAHILPTVLCVGVGEGTEADFQMSFDQYLARNESLFRDERHAYLYGCTCTKNHTLLNRLLESLKTSVFSQDIFWVTDFISLSDHGTTILWDYLDANWNKLPPGVSRMKCFTNIGLRTTTQDELDKLISFASNHPIGGDGYTNLILDIENNIKWFNEHGPGLKRWLEKHRSPARSSKVVKRGASSSLSVPSMNQRQPEGESYRSEFNEF